MKLAMNAGGFGPQVRIDIERIQKAEKLGYDSVWSAEAWGNDAISPLAWIAAQTTKIKLGTAIMQMPARTPAMAAMQAMCALLALLQSALQQLPLTQSALQQLQKHPDQQVSSLLQSAQNG